MPSHVLCTLFILILSFYKYTIFHNAHCCMHHSVKHQFIADIVPSTNWSIPLNPYLTFWNKYAYYFIYNISVCVSKTKYFLNIQVYYKEKNSLCTACEILVPQPGMKPMPPVLIGSVVSEPPDYQGSPNTGSVFTMKHPISLAF